MSPYLSEVEKAIHANFECECRHIGKVQILENFNDQHAWVGDVEVYELIGHPAAKRAYAWGHFENGLWEVTTVLEIPPVESAQTAVRAAIVAKAKQRPF
jgi:hypothetical protein